ncbi:hypothetical protein PIROE2DRAFT_5226 [Piromyces sp. E2]|nr:hypothetical protein PIROE2DRAFT_5226 [Piromyces sp. E2]|eukprot:OUM67364.1 hypothetical protein PIROE2DRAFT_5226 [Piromyces sp. E2]
MKIYKYFLFSLTLLKSIQAKPQQDEKIVQEKTLRDVGYGSFKSFFTTKNNMFHNALDENNDELSFNYKFTSTNSNGNTDTNTNLNNNDSNNNDNNNNNNNNSNSDNNDTTSNYNNIISSTTIQYSKINYSDTGFKESLGSFETYLYNKFLISAKKTLPDFSIVLYPANDGYKIDFKNVKVSMVTAFISFMYDHSEFWWIYSYRYNCEYSSKTLEVQKIEIDLCWSNEFCNRYSVSEIKIMNEALATAKYNLLSDIGDVDRKTSYQLLRVIHDTLIHHVSLTNDSNEDLFSTTIYGALVNRRCTSEGIAKAFKWIAEYYKITNVLAVGYGYQWNFVKLNNRWYVIDVTGDYKRSPNPDVNISYDLFLIGFSDITNMETNTSYENDITYNLIDRVKSTSNSLTYITYPDVHILNYFDTNGISKEDIFESTILKITTNSDFISSPPIPDATNPRVTTLALSFSTTVEVVIQGNLDLDSITEQIKEQYQCDSPVSITSINGNTFNNVNQKFVIKNDDDSSSASSLYIYIYKNNIIFIISFIMLFFLYIM